MIIRAGTGDYERAMAFLLEEGSLNTTQIAYIEKYGFEKDFQNIWFYEDDAKNTLAVVMRHFNSLYIYGKGSIFDYEEIAGFASFTGAEVISGKRDLLSEIALYMKGMVLETSRFMVLKDPSRLIACKNVEKAVLDDCPELAELIFSIPEFARFYSSKLEIERGIRRRMELGMCRYFVLRHGGVIASQAYTTIESNEFATIGGVVTRPEYRKHGLASLVVSCISRDILMSGKQPNLFYANEEAGRVYGRLGFECAADYAMLLSHRFIA